MSEFEIPGNNRQFSSVSQNIVFFSLGGSDTVVKTTIVSKFKVPRKNRQFSSVSQNFGPIYSLDPFRKTLVFFRVGGRNKVVKTQGKTVNLASFAKKWSCLHLADVLQ